MMFDPFGDFEAAGYLRNRFRLSDLDTVKRLEHSSFEANIEQALSYMARLADIEYASILDVHRMLFQEIYPWAGQDRVQLTPDLRISKGQKGEPGHTEFADAEDIVRAAEYALSSANKHARFRDRPGEVMGLLALAHPFLDGNGRTILLIFTELCYRAGFSIDWSKTTKDTYLTALSAEILDPSQRLLDEYLKPHIVAAAKRKDWPALIGGIEGLDGLDKEDLDFQKLDGSQPQPHYKGYLAERTQAL
ncbi:Fic family protein [Pseudomonas sp. CFBP 8770]|uniref:Fic family protein n=1 Tax=unclassified Pseudomonas TaxID=196821 RepID=UPI0017803055|nr:Fic family protein [Pseudomonas sp. CFBP 8773]MBD8645978.1 Fic family protein [Pseudomonas sp. CFBP 8770]